MDRIKKITTALVENSSRISVAVAFLYVALGMVRLAFTESNLFLSALWLLVATVWLANFICVLLSEKVEY